MISESEILRKIQKQPKRSAGFKQLVRELGLHGDQRQELNQRLQHLVSRGDLVQLDSDRYGLPQAAGGRNLIVGRLSMHRDGFGFVIPDLASLDARLKASIVGDVFIPPHATSSAMHGDKVLVEVTALRADGRAEGRIVRPVDRANATVVGFFHYGTRHNYVTPYEQKIANEIIIPPGMEIPDTPAEPAPRQKRTSVHRVIGDQAPVRSVWEDLEGVVVDVEITDWPGTHQQARGRVIEILGYEDDFGVDVEIMIRKFHLPHRFSAAVLQDAENVEPLIPSSELHSRRDFRHLPIVTIDGETARDFDDAVTVYLLENGNFELQVHIADVAHYVTDETPLDQEARLRGTSVYFPDRAVPMLPLELSTDICSLRPQVERLVMSSIMEIDHKGEVLHYELCPGVIRSAERMTYTEVNAILEGDAATRQRYASLTATFETMRDLAMILNQKRRRRGSIDFDLPEPVIQFDEFGLMRSITRSERNIAHRIIEEFMLAANETVASYLESKRVGSIYRVHEKPDAKRVYDFEVIAATFGYSLGVGALPIERMTMKTDRRSHRGTGKKAREIEIPKEVHLTPRMYQKLTDKIAGKPEERILSYLMLRSLKQARYSEENLGHFALAAPAYTHFTSPIRRYPDLIVHRILKAVLQDEPDDRQGAVPVGRGPLSHDSSGDNAPSPWSKRRDREDHRKQHEPLSGPISIEELHDIGEESSQSERRADEAERELMEWKKAKFMQEHVGEDFDGLIISVTKYGFYVELADLFVEGLVPLSTLDDDRYTFHENTREIIGQRTRRSFRLGQKLRVIVDRIDPVEKKIRFALFEERPQPMPKSRRRGKRT